MADLDTAAKRRAAVQFQPWMIMPDADGTIGDADRAQAAGVYSGIAIGAAAIVLSALKIMSLKLNQQLSMSISYTGDCIPLSLVASVPTDAPAAGKGLVAYVDAGTLKIAAWTGASWVTT
jgi:hypothetical protein